MPTARPLCILTCAVCVVLAAAAEPSVAAAPPSDDPATAADVAAAWLATQITEDGFVDSPFSPESASAQAVVAFAATGAGGEQVDALLDYLETRTTGGFVTDAAGDKPGALAYLILAAVADGRDPTGFGGTDLVARLLATEQPDGLFGAQDPSFDGAYRQGLALLALAAAGEPAPAPADWLLDQQCDSGLWTSFRSDLTVDCPAVDPANFVGPDTNSTALAVLGLAANGEGSAAKAGSDALDVVRTAGGGWGYLAAGDQPVDASSTGLAAAALRATSGEDDDEALAALLQFQVGCDADPLDRGGIAFQPQGGQLFPDALATVQAIPALAGAELPVVGEGVLAGGLPAVCAPAGASTATTPADSTTTTGGQAPTVQPTATLPATGSDPSLLALIGLALVGAGVAVLAQRRRRTAGP